MKKIFTFLIFLVAVISVSAQYQVLFDFEDGKDTTIWIPFANGKDGTKKDISVVLNPLSDNVNNSDSVLMFIVHDNSDPWVGMYTDSLEMVDGAIEFTTESHILSMMVNKSKSSPLRLKLEQSLTGGKDWSAEVVNDKTDEWQLLSFDFTEVIGQYYGRLTVFPDFPAKREGGTTAYLDNIAISTPDNTAIKEFEGSKMKLYPNPAEFRMAVLYPEMTGVKILNINGQEIRTIKFSTTNQKVIEVGDLSAGSYFVTALTSKGNFTMPFIKK